MRLTQIIANGILRSNPTFVLLLGLCPTLAVSTSLDNAIGMTAAVLFVLFVSNVIVSLLRMWIPPRVRIPAFIVIIATLVTLVELALKAYSPALSRSLGIYVPLIVVNCIILGRAEAFASKNPVFASVADAVGMATGFGLAIVIVSAIRQLLGTGSLSVFSMRIVRLSALAETPLVIFVLPMGAFFVLGLLLALLRWIGVSDCE